MSQAPFTIVRPADGSRVREKVHILIPKGSIPPGGYVGIFLNDKLVEAVVPPLNGKYYDYVLDTKGRKLPDTPDGKTEKLEVVLYTDFNEKARIVDRSSVNVRIGNQANIPVPNAGLKLRYKFVPGQELVYNLTQRVSVSPMTDIQNENGGRAATFDSEGEKIRLSYTVVNSYGNGDGLLRLQALPQKGKDYADLTAGDDTQQKRWYDTDMAPLYMRINSTGHEIFGALPAYIGFEGSVGSANTGGLFAAFPLPTLPTKSVRPGDRWQSRFQDGDIKLDDWVGMKSVVDKSEAVGEFVGVEWESGHPCAKIRNIIEAGEKNSETKKLEAKGAQFSGDKIKVQETIWFAMDTRQILKIERDLTIDQKIQTAAPSFGGPSGGFPGGPSGPGGPNGPPGGFGGPMPGSGSGYTGFPVPINQNAPVKGRPVQGNGPAQTGRPGFGSGMNAGGRTSSATFIRIHRVMTFTLEK